MIDNSSEARPQLGIFSRLKSDRSGIAMVEFALGLPLLSFISIGGMELTNYSAAKMRASQIALMVADNAGRVRVSIDEADIDEVMIGAKIEGEVMKWSRHPLKPRTQRLDWFKRRPENPLAALFWQKRSGF
jgi:hypothetical protein